MSTFAFSLLVISTHYVCARTWIEVIDKSVYETLLIDPFRDKFAQEYDPLNLTKTSGTYDGSATNDPTGTHIDQNQTRNECGADEILHIIRMFDSWGDGWDHTVMEISDDNEKNSTEKINSSETGIEEDDDQQNDDEQTDDRNNDDAGDAYGQTDDARNDDGRTDDGNDNVQQSEESDDGYNDDGGTDDGDDDSKESLKQGILSYLGNRKLSEVITSNIENIEQTTNSEQNSTESLLSGSKLVFKGSLKDGSAGNGTVCLKVGKCYTISVAGGLWPTEVKWDIRQTITNSSSSLLQQLFLSIAKGVGAAKCKFSVSDPTTGEQACPFTCEGVKEMEESLSDVFNKSNSTDNVQNSTHFNFSSVNNPDSTANSEKVKMNQTTATNSSENVIASVPTNTTSWNTSKNNISSTVSNGVTVSLIEGKSQASDSINSSLYNRAPASENGSSLLYDDRNETLSADSSNTGENEEALSRQSENKEGTFVEAFQFPEPVRSPSSAANTGNLRTLSPGVGEIFDSIEDPGVNTFSPSPSMIPSTSSFPTTSSYPTSSAFPTFATDRHVSGR
jgi:hypothetical protein